MVNKNSLCLVVLPGKNPPKELGDYYNAAYHCWKITWEEAASELKEMPEKRNSSEFIRQDEVLALFTGENCTSLGFWTELDFTYIASQEDYYFHKWTHKALRALVRDGVMVGKYSYLTVAKNFRQDTTIPFKEIQVALFTKRFLESACHSMTGTTRNNRNVNQVCARNGAVLIEENLVQHGVSVDLMSWYKSTAKPWSEIAQLVDQIWKNRIDFKNLNQKKLKEELYEPRNDSEFNV